MRSAIGAETRIKSHAAIDKQCLASYVIGMIRAQPHSGMGYVFRLTYASVRYQCHQFIVSFLSVPRRGVDWRARGTRANTVHADFDGCQFLRQALHEHAHAPFGRSIVYMATPWYDFMY